MAFYKSAVKVGGAFALILGGILIDFYSEIGVIEAPLIGAIQPWQATLMTVGFPGLLLAMLIATMIEPSRKDVVATATGETHLPIRTVANFLWSRKRTYLALFMGSSMLAMAGYGSAAWYPEYFIRTYGVSKTEAGFSFGLIILIGGSLGVMLGPAVSNWLARKGHTDSYVRAIMYASIIAVFSSGCGPSHANHATHPDSIIPRHLIRRGISRGHGGFVPTDHAESNARSDNSYLHLRHQHFRDGGRHLDSRCVYRLSLPRRQQTELLNRDSERDLLSGCGCSICILPEGLSC